MSPGSLLVLLLVGGIVFGALGFAAYVIIAQIISATVGAIILLYAVRLLKRA